MNHRSRTPEVCPLSAGHDSLAFGVPSGARHTLYALATTGGVAAAPCEGRTILFGRNRPQVHICVGEYDIRVSRCHGVLTHQGNTWWVSTRGRVPIRLAGSRLLFAEDEPIPLAEGYTPVFVPGSSGRQHLLELFVTGSDASVSRPRPSDPTQPPRTWRLSAVERLVLVVLAQRYLLHESYPQPLSWRQAAEHLADLDPAADWNAKRVEHLVAGVRSRLSKDGVPGLTREQIGEPIGNLLNHNLIGELMESTTLVPPDLRLLDREDD